MVMPSFLGFHGTCFSFSKLLIIRFVNFLN